MHFVEYKQKEKGKRKADSARAGIASLHARHAYVPRKSALLGNLVYQNQQNSAAAVKGFHCMKRTRKGPMSPYALRKMRQKFETTGLDIILCRG
ncbi:hypothetical protein TNIN_18171 [Trichonephila inaurata madagascariensis]|uniref:Uncharacterized protein n=1 Tax=Trichonephila inaurata madagascariensis TaxID=2747483 RepID=A0A8X6X368_9ARAC|nr:hypothetical protein TNIN_18171 [Trichonephila inaurata madagascariensis]